MGLSNASQPHYRADLAEQDEALSTALAFAITYERDHKYGTNASSGLYSSEEYWIWTGIGPYHNERKLLYQEPALTFKEIAWDIGHVIVERFNVRRAILEFCSRGRRIATT